MNLTKPVRAPTRAQLHRLCPPEVVVQDVLDRRSHPAVYLSRGEHRFGIRAPSREQRYCGDPQFLRIWRGPDQRVVAGQAGCVRRNRHAGKVMAHRLECTDGLPELLALLRVSRRSLEHRLAPSDHDAGPKKVRAGQCILSLRRGDLREHGVRRKAEAVEVEPGDALVVDTRDGRNASGQFSW